MNGSGSVSGERRPFPTTSWSNILHGAKSDAALRRQTLERLFRHYWKPVYTCARFGWNLTPTDAEDVVQSFFLDLLERDFLQGMDPSRGRFRSFLKGALKNFIMNIKRDARRLKRGGGARVFPLEEAGKLTSTGGDPENIFDRDWSKTLLGHATERLQMELTRMGKEKAFRVFERYDLGERPESYQSVAEALGVSESDVRNQLHHAREAFRRIVVELIWEYALDEEDAKQELHWILG